MPPHGLSRELHVPAGDQGLLLERLASASVAVVDAGTGDQPVHAVESHGRSAVAARHALSRRAACSMRRPRPLFATPTVNGYRRFRPNSLAPDRADLGLRPSRRDGARARRRRAIRRRGSRTASASRRPIRISISPSQIVTGLDGIDNNSDPGPQEPIPTARDRAAAAEDLSGALDRAGAGAAVSSRDSATSSSTIIVALKRTEARPLRRNSTSRPRCVDPASDEPTDWEQNEYFDFFLTCERADGSRTLNGTSDRA